MAAGSSGEWVNAGLSVSRATKRTGLVRLLSLLLTVAWHKRQHVLFVSAYLLIFGRRRDDVVHQRRHQLGHSIHSCRGCPVLRGATYGLSLGLGLVHPFARYRVYDVEYSQLVCSWCFLEMGIKLLDENRFGLFGIPN